MSRAGFALVFSECHIVRNCVRWTAVALAAEKAFGDLKAPIRRLAPPSILTPFARELERASLPDENRIYAAIRHVLVA